MTWTLFLQVCVLIVLVTICIGVLVGLVRDQQDKSER